MKPYQHVILGSGALGLSVARELLANKEPVRIVNRSGRVPLTEEMDVVKADLYDPAQVFDVVNGARVVYMCAAPRYHEWEKKFPPLMRSVIAGTQKANVRLVFGDNLYAYGEVQGVIREDTPLNARTRKGRVRIQLVDELMRAHQAGNLQVCIGRASDFFGPYARNSTLGERVFIPMLQGKAASVMGDPDQPHTFTFIDDFGRALILLGERPESSGQVYHVPNAPTLTTRQVVEKAFSLIGMPVKMTTMGRLMLAMGGLFIPEARESVEMLYQVEKPFVVDSSRFTRVFGMTATPLEAALQTTIDWFRDIPE
ncbi:MAG: NAD-dependent epimerase/dehydratase family protein [Leptolinea sp.]|jgi:nucleoside-diphosphate-sugar epimerase|nr:NAD-dependent epimerase/dehydratase family protein [Leptolinea sp.]